MTEHSLTVEDAERPCCCIEELGHYWYAITVSGGIDPYEDCGKFYETLKLYVSNLKETWKFTNAQIAPVKSIGSASPEKFVIVFERAAML